MFSVANILLLVFIGCAAAQNVINSIDAGTTMVAGQAFTITWTPDSSSTVTLTLRSGDSSDLSTIGAIAIDIPNTGSYTWYPETSLPSGSDYALEIADSDGSNPNYSHYFAITGGAASSAATTSGASTTASGSTTLPSSLVTDSTLSATASASGSSILIVSGNSTSTSFSSVSSTSSAASASSSGSSTTSKSSASKTVASASASSSSAATNLLTEFCGGQGVRTLIALSLASMIFCMM